MNKTKIAINLILAVIVGIGIWFTFHSQSPTPKTQLATKILPEQLPGFSMKDIAGIIRNSSEWKGKILVINFWATWCPPCIEEMPVLTEFQEEYSSMGVQVVGVAVDNPEQVKDFVDLYDINFPVVVGQNEAIELGKMMGNRISALPYTAIFDRKGKTLYAQPGKISEETLKRVVRPLL